MAAKSSWAEATCLETRVLLMMLQGFGEKGFRVLGLGFRVLGFRV